MHCPVCSTPVIEGKTICHACHAPLEGQSSAQAERQVLEAAPQTRSVFLSVMPIALAGVSLALVMLLVSQALEWDAFVSLCCLWVGSAFLMVLGQAALYFSANRRAIQRLFSEEAGQVLHWTYSEQEWRQFISQDLQEGDGGPWKLVVVASLTLVIGILCLRFYQVSPNVIVGAMLFLCWVFFSISLLFLLGGLFLQRLWTRQKTGDASISLAGVLLGGQYQSLVGLPRITYEAGNPAKIRFVIYRGSPDLDTVEVPVPRDREAEAKRWVDDLQWEDFSFCGRCGKPIAAGFVSFSRVDNAQLCQDCARKETTQTNIPLPD